MERLVLLPPPDYPALAPCLAPRQEMKGGFRPAINKERSIFKLHDLMPPRRGRRLSAGGGSALLLHFSRCGV